jgi:hypothetical protein
VWINALGAIFDSLRSVGIIAAAALSQAIKGTKTKHTVKVLGLIGGVTGEVFALFVAEESALSYCVIHLTLTSNK